MISCQRCCACTPCGVWGGGGGARCSPGTLDRAQVLAGVASMQQAWPGSPSPPFPPLSVAPLWPPAGCDGWTERDCVSVEFPPTSPVARHTHTPDVRK